MRLVIFFNGCVWMMMAGLMLVPALVDPATARIFLGPALLALFLGGGLALAAGRGEQGFRRRHAFLLTASAWVSACAAAALPLLAWGEIGAADAAFEAVSAITTTGSTVLTGLDGMARGLLAWRALLQWIGGVGVIVMSIAVLPFLRIGGMQLFRTENSDRADKELTSAARFAAAVLWIYAALTMLCAAAYSYGGMGGFDAVTHAMTSVATAGFANYDASMAHFRSPFIEWTAIVFMIAGSLPFVWYIRAITRRVFTSEQLAFYLPSLAIIVLAMALWLMVALDRPAEEALRLAAFNVVSVITTTGYATDDYGAWGEAPVAAFFVIMFFGGCTGSAAGGIKAMRLTIAVKMIRQTTRRVMSPNAVDVATYEGRRIDQETFGAVIAFFMFFLISFLALALALDFAGLDLLTSLSGAATAIANVGPGLGPVIGPAGNFQPLPDAAKWLLAFGMLLGRLEIMTVLLLFTLRYWRD